MILSVNILTIYILDIIFFVFGTIALFSSIKISLYWDINKTTPYQYSLEKQSYLSATIIKYILYLKIPLILFFVFTLDNLSIVLPGAMCAAGVVDATQYGTYLLILKILNIYIFGFWLLLHNQDIKIKTLPFTKLKFNFFIIIYILLITEIAVEFLMFSSIDPQKLVNCCGSLYSSNSSSYIAQIFKLDNSTLLTLFYGIYFLIIFNYIFRVKYIFGLLNLAFLIFSIVSLIVLFGTYIYELPTHHCPFCLLQSDYNYIGYFIYSFLFIGTFNGISTIYFNNDTNYKISLYCNSLVVILLTYYPIFYYIKNGVWL